VHGGIAANLLGIVPHAQAERESYSMISFILRNHLLVSYFVGHHKDALEVLGLIDCAGVYGCAHSLDRGHAHHLTIGLALFIGHQIQTCQDQGMVVVQGICIGEGVQFLLPFAKAVEIIFHIPRASQSWWIPGFPDFETLQHKVYATTQGGMMI